MAITSLDKNRRNQTKHHTWRWVVAGFVLAVLSSGIFVGGYQFGRGTWSLNFKISTVSQNKNLPNNLDYSSVNQVYQQLKKKYDGKISVDQLVLGLKKGLVEAAGDPYTTYMDATTAKDFNEQLNGSFSGIGAELGKEGNNIVVISPLSGFPADKAGLKPKDVVIEIDGQDASGLSVDEAVHRIRGEKGTTVKLVVIRNSQERLEFSIIRDTITIPSVEHKIINNNIGYIKISRFADDTQDLTDKAANEFANKNLKGIIVDLRNNPGGYLNAAVDISGKWLRQGQVILQEKRSGKVIQTYRADNNGQFVGMPTVILLNEGSASASEIMAGALKDNKAATIIGVKSFGKGSVQEFSNFDNGDSLKVTIARWYTPAGKNIDKQGISPTTKIELTDADIKASKDPQIDAAIAVINR